MKLYRESKPIVKVPHRAKNGFYACPCGNILVSYNCQAECEACGAKLDWDNVVVSQTELEQDRQERKIGRNRKWYK
jgi:transcription initiation factor IIE alpha subunit